MAIAQVLLVTWSRGDVSSPTGESPGVCSVRRRAAWKPGDDPHTQTS